MSDFHLKAVARDKKHRDQGKGHEGGVGWVGCGRGGGHNGEEKESMRLQAAKNCEILAGEEGNSDTFFYRTKGICSKMSDLTIFKINFNKFFT